MLIFVSVLVLSHILGFYALKPNWELALHWCLGLTDLYQGTPTPLSLCLWTISVSTISLKALHKCSFRQRLSLPNPSIVYKLLPCGSDRATAHLGNVVQSFYRKENCPCSHASWGKAGLRIWNPNSYLSTLSTTFHCFSNQHNCSSVEASRLGTHTDCYSHGKASRNTKNL